MITKNRQDGRDKTLGLLTPESLLSKLLWELSQLEQLAGSGRAEIYTTINAAITAWQLCDWVSSELDVRDNGWKTASEALGVDLRKKKDLMDFVARDTAIRACRQIATASKHVVVDYHDASIVANGLDGIGNVFLFNGEDVLAHRRMMQYVIAGNEQMSSVHMISSAALHWVLIFEKLGLDGSEVINPEELVDEE